MIHGNIFAILRLLFLKSHRIKGVLFQHFGKASSVNDKIQTRYGEIVSVFDNVACRRNSFYKVVM